jgi:D-glycero-D-manno-heptose 1,7-bisphosphate phosphatase
MSITSRRPCVFLDRDGVINAAIVRQGLPHPPASVEELTLLPDAPDACRRLSQAGFALVVITNQPDVARGTTDLVTVNVINDHLRERMDFDAFYVCPHDDSDGCDCRKPGAGMLLQAAADLDLDLATSYMVGDRWKDIEAGESAGCRTVFIDRGYGERRPSRPTHVARGLGEATEWILADAEAVTHAT